jgi:hypothetical protein
MREFNVTLDIICRPWTAEPETYRLYIDNDLITERTFLWDKRTQFIREHVTLGLSAGTHNISIEKLNPRSPAHKIMFDVKNLTLDGESLDLQSGQFVIR